MNVGMVCWALIGAQGRYRLATMVASACTLLITLPIGIYLTLELRYNLKGLTFAVVVGNSVTAMCLTYVLLMSNWENLSLKAQRKSKVNGVSHSDSMSTEDSSESENEDGGIYIKALPLACQKHELLVAEEESFVSDIEVTAGDFSKVLREADEHLRTTENGGMAGRLPRGLMSIPRWGAVPGSSVFSLKLNSRDANLEDKERQYVQAPQTGVRSTIRTEPIYVNKRSKSPRGKDPPKRGGTRAKLLIKSSKRSALYQV